MGAGDTSAGCDGDCPRFVVAAHPPTSTPLRKATLAHFKVKISCSIFPAAALAGLTSSAVPTLL
jgi:hypothetical protein